MCMLFEWIWTIPTKYQPLGEERFPWQIALLSPTSAPGARWGIPLIGALLLFTSNYVAHRFDRYSSG